MAMRKENMKRSGLLQVLESLSCGQSKFESPCCIVPKPKMMLAYFMFAKGLNAGKIRIDSQHMGLENGKLQLHGLSVVVWCSNLPLVGVIVMPCRC